MNDMRKLMEEIAALSEETTEEGITGRPATNIVRKALGKVPYVEGADAVVHLTVDQLIMKMELGMKARNSNDPEFLQKLMGDARKELIDLQKWLRKK
jgi:hypothetical protein